MTPISPFARLFQSTLSVRRATKPNFWNVLRKTISIHALRKESDPNHRRRTPEPTDFNPRSP